MEACAHPTRVVNGEKCIGPSAAWLFNCDCRFFIYARALMRPPNRWGLAPVFHAKLG